MTYNAIFTVDGEEYAKVPTKVDDQIVAPKDPSKEGYTFAQAELQMVPQNYITLTDEGDIKNMSKMLEMFDDNEDVQNVWHNWENEE